MKPALLTVAALLAVAFAGCLEPYESGSLPEEQNPVECEPTTEPEHLDDGVPNPLRCRLENETPEDAGAGVEGSG